MTATELQDALLNLFETLADAREEIDGDDDEISLADFLRDLADDFEGAATARSYGRDMMMTTDAGLTVRCADGAELQITIVQTRQGTGEGDEGEGADFDDSDLLARRSDGLNTNLAARAGNRAAGLSNPAATSMSHRSVPAARTPHALTSRRRPR